MGSFIVPMSNFIMPVIQRVIEKNDLRFDYRNSASRNDEFQIYQILDSN